MKKTAKRLLSVFMAMAMMTTLLISVSASEIEPYSGRFKYFTVTDPNWTYSHTETVTAEDSKNYQKIENSVFTGIKLAVKGVPYSGLAVSVVQNFIRENNLDNADVGTYAFYTKNVIRYKEHLLTGERTVDSHQVQIRIVFNGGGIHNERTVSVTLR